MESTGVRYPAPETGGALARRTTLGVLVAIVALLVTQAIVNSVGIEVVAPATMSPFTPTSLIGATVVAGIGAAIVYTAMVRFTDRPARNFAVVAVDSSLQSERSSRLDALSLGPFDVL